MEPKFTFNLLSGKDSITNHCIYNLMKDVGRDERCSHVLPWWTPKDESLVIAHISQIITSTKKIISFKLWKIHTYIETPYK